MSRQDDAMELFLQAVQRRALRIAELSLGHRDDALDAVQDAMFKLVQKYAGKPQADWTPLFYRILYSRITDCQRRRSRSSRVFGHFFLSQQGNEDVDEDPIQIARDPAEPNPARFCSDGEFGEQLDCALAELSERQRQAFLLRAWEGLNVRETAIAMRCSEGSVKTHYSRARQQLQELLRDFSG